MQFVSVMLCILTILQCSISKSGNQGSADRPHCCVPTHNRFVIFIVLSAGLPVKGSASSKQASQSSAEADDARRRFGNAKSISSSMFDENANKANDYEKQAMLSKFSVSQPDMLQSTFWMAQYHSNL